MEACPLQVLFGICHNVVVDVYGDDLSPFPGKCRQQGSVIARPCSNLQNVMACLHLKLLKHGRHHSWLRGGTDGEAILVLCRNGFICIHLVDRYPRQKEMPRDCTECRLYCWGREAPALLEDVNELLPASQRLLLIIAGERGVHLIPVLSHCCLL